MQVIQATLGTFHHFHLARELKSRGYLKQIYSTYPWRRLRREGLPRESVTTFPWLHTSQMVAGRYISIPKSIDRPLGDWIATSFDAWVSRQLSACDAFVSLSGSGSKSGERAQQLGAKYVCDRGSSHARYQQQLLHEEYRRWKVPFAQASSVDREEREYEIADAITVLSEFARRSFIECGVPPEKVYKMLLGVQLEVFRQTAEPPIDSFEVLFAGTVSFRKGIPYLLEGFRRLKHPRKRLRIVGFVPQEIRPYLKTQDLTDIEITGPRSQAELAHMMSQSHALVLPSIEDGFGMVLTQAMACGCPVISTTNTGGPDLYTNGEEGFIIPIRSPEAIHGALQQLAEDSSLRAKMSAASLGKVQSFGGWHQYGENFANFLKRLCGCA
ncbi:glycosyltransferase family 4 protein [Alloacidobacterium dinghuense]|uniref:Glycosyltransferase family 4 protein n=1 Tax=Alloacidobacterium dinghuense TaxID=2763107 RepID=A0A7G8BN39_9BACT|nr:glycosyltransferase family 4 protein [Alloacidobacterium dinghuense]QNI33959.1 glycosyltransferase family 4 protein [Alloacidobacterium dinghuense]